MTRHMFVNLSESQPLRIHTPHNKGEKSWACVAGYQTQDDDGTDRWVDLSLRYGGSHYSDPAYASATLTPDEARGLAARLLDAADDADEQRYTLTAKGEAALA